MTHEQQKRYRRDGDVHFVVPEAAAPDTKIENLLRDIDALAGAAVRMANLSVAGTDENVPEAGALNHLQDAMDSLHNLLAQLQLPGTPQPHSTMVEQTGQPSSFLTVVDRLLADQDTQLARLARNAATS